MIKDKKLRGGPGMTGTIQPIRATNTRSNPKIINNMVKWVSYYNLMNRSRLDFIIAV